MFSPRSGSLNSSELIAATSSADNGVGLFGVDVHLLHGIDDDTILYTAFIGQGAEGGEHDETGVDLEEVAQFAAAGVDFLKLDAGCGTATTLHDGIVLGSLRRVGTAINATRHATPGRHRAQAMR